MRRRFHEMPFGARPAGEGRWRFRLWAPAARNVELLLGEGGAATPMEPLEEGWWEGVREAEAGLPYLYRIDGGRALPDPASRAQAEDVHGPSLLVDPGAHRWRDGEWRGRPWEEAVFYELHVGTFTPEGSFAAASARLGELAEIGITALELMPVGDFPGGCNWGYDGVLPFAPERRYGSPDDLKRLVEAAHGAGLMIFLDVIYNHFGPEGNYLHLYAPAFFTDRHRTPWGAAIDFEGEGSRTVRDFFIHNALYWLEEYHFDGLRLDAVHAIFDASTPDILEELAGRVAARFKGRRVHLVLENDDNAARYLAPLRGKAPFRAQWNDDFHHCLHVICTGEEGGYYEDFREAPHDKLARCLAEGFAFQGEPSRYRNRRRGEPSRHLPVTAFVNFLQNHDQIGNRAFGERISRLAPPEAVRAATVLLLLAPAVPLLFMGEEWGSGQPFPFFCDFGPELARSVAEGRRRELARWPGFGEGGGGAAIPEPDQRSFADAALRREERERPEGRAWLDLHRRLLTLRRREIVPRLRGVTGRDGHAARFGEGGIAARWRLNDGSHLLLVANLSHEEVADITPPAAGLLHATPHILGWNGTLAPWGAACYLAPPPGATLLVNDEPILP